MTMMKKNGLALVVVAALAMMSQIARADDDYLKLRFSDCSPTQTGYAYLDGVMNNNVYVGQYNLEVKTDEGFTGPNSTALVNQAAAAAVNPAIGAVIGAFCIDVRQESSNGFKTYNATTALEAAPVNGGASMGITKANDLRKLFAAHWTANLTADQAAAFQSDIWEIINETSGNYNLATGNFRVTESSGSGWTALGNSWLDELSTDTAMRMDVMALTSDDYQDYAVTVSGGYGTPGDITPSVPEPATIMGLLMGVGGLARYVRRRIAFTI